MLRRALLVGLGLGLGTMAAAGCNPALDVGFGVAITLDADRSITDAALGRATVLHVDAAGDESYHVDYPFARAVRRQERVIYRPGSNTRELDLTFTLQSAMEVLGTGTSGTFAVPAGHTTTRDIVLFAPGAGPDMAGSVLDGGEGEDLPAPLDGFVPRPDGPVIKPDAGVVNPAHPFFIAGTNYLAADGGHSIVSADFNGDGVLDLAVANSTAPFSVGVYLGLGDGTFGPQHLYPISGTFGPFELALADLDGNTRPDLILATNNTSTGTLQTLIGQADGSFVVSPTIVAGGGVWVRAGNLDGDAQPDVATFNGSNLVVRLNAYGATPKTQNLALGAVANNMWSIAFGDFNHDGKQDLAVAGNSTVQLFLNQGAGTLAAGPVLTGAISTGFTMAAAGDLDGDGWDDLAVTSDTNIVVVFLNQKDGTGALLPKGTFPAGVHPSSLALGDLNHDGRLDVVAADYDGSACVAVLLNNGDGSLAAPTLYATGDRPRAIAIGDFDGDGHPDVAVTANHNSSSVTILLNRGDGRLFGATSVPFPVATSLATATLDGNSHPDFVVAGSQLGSLLDDGSGTLTPGPLFTIGSAASAMAVGDVTRDSQLDVVLTSSTLASLSVVSQFGGVDLGGAVTQFPLSAPAIGLALAQLNGDSALDGVALLNNSRVQAVFNPFESGADAGPPFDLAGVALPPNAYAVGAGAMAVAVGDLDGNGTPDVVTANNGSGDVSVLRNAGDGRLSGAASYPAGTLPSALALGDLDGDGHLDLVVTLSPAAGEGTVVVLRGDGNGAFGAPSAPYAVGRTPQSVLLADFDGDGHLDVVIGNRKGDSVTLLFGDGAGGLRAGGSFAAGGNPAALAAVDVNSDGRLDLVVSGAAGNCAVLINEGL